MFHLLPFLFIVYKVFLFLLLDFITLFIRKFFSKAIFYIVYRTHVNRGHSSYSKYFSWPFACTYSGVSNTRAGCKKQAGRIFHKICRNEQVVLSEQGGIYLKFHESSRLQLGMSRVLLEIISLLTLRFLS